jgi:hypothetical protein
MGGVYAYLRSPMGSRLCVSSCGMMVVTFAKISERQSIPFCGLKMGILYSSTLYTLYVSRRPFEHKWGRWLKYYSYLRDIAV